VLPSRALGARRYTMSQTDPPDFQRYRLLNTLGEGGTARVVRAFDTRTRRFVARKEPLEPHAETNQHLVDEARLMAFLDHPGVVPVYSLDDDPLHPTYTMKIVTGRTLMQVLKLHAQSNRYLPVSDVLNTLTRVCETMANAHEKGVLHLDLKPGNIMLQPFGHVIVMDWGIACFHDPRPYVAYLSAGGIHMEADDLRRRVEGASGTRPYMSLEQLTRPRAELGPPADIFSAGVMLYMMLTGRRPYPKKGSLDDQIEARQHAPPVRVETLRPDVAIGLAEICHRMLAVKAHERYASFREVLEDVKGLTDVAASALLMDLQADEVLFSEGDPSGAVYQVMEGEVQVTIDVDGERKIIATLGPGEILGELAMLSGAPRSATVRATCPTMVAELTPELIEHELAKVHPLVGHIVRSLSDRLIGEVDKRRRG